MTIASVPPSLSDDLRALEGQFPGWHCWHSDTGIIHATTCRCPEGGSGTTLEARTPQLMRQVIAERVHLWALGVAS